MPTVEVINQRGEKVEEMVLRHSVFAVEPNMPLMHQAVVSYLANRRQGTHSTKTRGEVRGGGRKPWRQKGTGRARQGSIRAPHWVGGGVVFGPRPRDYSFYLSKEERRQALCSALSSKLAYNDIIILDQLSLPEPKTREMERILTSLGIQGERTLLVLDQEDPVVLLAARNIPYLEVRQAKDLCTYDVLACAKLVMTKRAVEVIQERLEREQR